MKISKFYNLKFWLRCDAYNFTDIFTLKPSDSDLNFVANLQDIVLRQKPISKKAQQSQAKLLKAIDNWLSWTK